MTAPPFHVYCRSTTAPYFDENFGDVGERAARNADGRTYYVPADMTYEEWEKKQNELYGEGTVEKLRKMGYNESADKKQFEDYKNRLGEDAPKKFKEFQELKYDDKAGYDELVGYYSYKGRVPEATKADYKAYKAVKATGVIGTVRVPPRLIEIDALVFKDTHGIHHGCTLEDAKQYVRTAKCSIRRKRWDGMHTNYYSFNGATYIHDDINKINTAFPKAMFDPDTKAIMEVFK